MISKVSHFVYDRMTIIPHRSSNNKARRFRSFNLALGARKNVKCLLIKCFSKDWRIAVRAYVQSKGDCTSTRWLVWQYHLLEAPAIARTNKIAKMKVQGSTGLDFQKGKFGFEKFDNAGFELGQLVGISHPTTTAPIYQ